ncbi:hypothetical protein KAW64_12910 [bacterium]|nr:hypothetical protein [bacterium]
MKVALVALAALALSACCVFGGQQVTPHVDLSVSMLWAGELPPAGTTAVVDFYLMAEGTGSWDLIELDVPHPGLSGTLVDTFWYACPVALPADGTKVTYRYEVDMTVGGEVYSFACESGEWRWYAAGAIHCCERER